MQRPGSLEKTLMVGGTEGIRRRGRQRKRFLDGITDSIDMSLSILQKMVKDREFSYAVVHRFTKNQTWLSHWTTKIPYLSLLLNLLYIVKMTEFWYCQQQANTPSVVWKNLLYVICDFNEESSKDAMWDIQ